MATSVISIRGECSGFYRPIRWSQVSLGMPKWTLYSSGVNWVFSIWYLFGKHVYGTEDHVTVFVGSKLYGLTLQLSYSTEAGICVSKLQFILLSCILRCSLRYLCTCKLGSFLHQGGGSLLSQTYWFLGVIHYRWSHCPMSCCTDVCVQWPWHWLLTPQRKAVNVPALWGSACLCCTCFRTWVQIPRTHIKTTKTRHDWVPVTCIVERQADL